LNIFTPHRKKQNQASSNFAFIAEALFNRYLTAVKWESCISSQSPDSDVIETACWYGHMPLCTLSIDAAFADATSGTSKPACLQQQPM
jgi:hypothetical protein